MPVRLVEVPGMGHVGPVAALAAPVRALGLAPFDAIGELRLFLGSIPRRRPAASG